MDLNLKTHLYNRHFNGVVDLSFLGTVVSNPIGMEFGRIVPRVNTHRSTESDFGYEIILSRWRP